MNQTDAKRIITLFLFVGGGLNAARAVRRGQSQEIPRIFIGVGIAALVLSLLSEAIPQVAGPVALTALVVSIFYGDTPDLILGVLGTGETSAT